MTDRDTRLFGPLVLGSSGRIGTLWRHLFQTGLWPGAAPLWHARSGDADYLWDMTAPAPADPRLAQVRGMIVLAGATGGGEDARACNVDCARAALDLAGREGIAPVLLCSSSAVYGRPEPGNPPFREDSPRRASDGYGAAKYAMEKAAAAHPVPSTALRIANVAGADALLLAAARGPLVDLHILPDGIAPRRHWIGPETLARTCLALIDAWYGGTTLPPVLNVGMSPEIAMSDLLDAAGVAYDWNSAPETVLPSLPLDLSRLASLVSLPQAAPENLVAEALDAGWHPFVADP